MKPTDQRSNAGHVGAGQRRHISVRLAIACLLASAAIAVLVSAVQIYFSYRQEMAAAGTRFSQIETGYLPSLADGLWELDAKGVDDLLDAIAQLPNVGRVTLTDESSRASNRNMQSETPFSQRDFVLRHSEGGTQFEVGRLHVELVSTGILRQLKSRALEITITALLALLGNSLFVLILFHRWVTRHLVRMARFAADFDPARLDVSLVLDRPRHGREDELDLVVDSFNGMQRIISDELQNRSRIEHELRLHRDKLEALVEERTLAYRYSAEQLEIAASVAELGVWSWNLADDSVQWNERMFAMYSQPLALRDTGLSFKHWQQCLHPDDAEVATSRLLAAIENRRNYAATFRIVTPTGESRYIHAKAQVVCDAAGNAVMVTGINRDITDQAELEARLIRAKEQADAASAAKSSFLANMSHEIRTPLNAVLGMLQLVQKTHLDMRQHDYVTKAQIAANSLLSLLNDILDYSKIEAGKLELEQHAFELDDFLQELAIVLGGNQSGDAVEVRYDIDATLPQTLVGDSLRLKQVLINLAGNALKFTPQGHVTVSVRELARAGETVRVQFAVTDTGIGIDASQQQFIFEGFAQAEASISRRFGGTGLGLVICRRLVALMGGELRLESELGRGSRFWFDIELKVADATPLNIVAPAVASGRALIADTSARSEPLAETDRREQSMAMQTPLDSSAITRKMQRLAGLRLLVVEDNELNRQVAVELLKSEGAEVEAATGGQAGVDCVLAAVRPFDAVVMDMQMPDVDGLEATRRIRAVERFRALPILAMTANASQSDRELCLAAGMNGHVSKPIDLDRVVTVLRALTQRLPPDGGEMHRHDAGLHAECDSLIEDTAVILRRFLNNADLLRGMLARFRPDQERLLHDLAKQIEQQDSNGARATLHTIKGSAGTMGARAMALYAADLERCLKAGDGVVLDNEITLELTRLLAVSVAELEAAVATIF